MILAPLILAALFTVSGQHFKVECTYAARGGIAIAYPAYKKLPAIVYVRPWICREPNRAVRSGHTTNRTGAALLVLVHESLHIGGLRDECETEAQAVRLLPTVAARLGINTPKVRKGARVMHSRLVAASLRHCTF